MPLVIGFESFGVYQWLFAITAMFFASKGTLRRPSKLSWSMNIYGSRYWKHYNKNVIVVFSLCSDIEKKLRYRYGKSLIQILNQVQIYIQWFKKIMRYWNMYMCCDIHHKTITVHCKTGLLALSGSNYTVNGRILAYIYHASQTTGWVSI